MWNDLYISAAAEHDIGATMATLVNESLADLSASPHLAAGVERVAARHKKLFAAATLGIPTPTRFPTVYDFFDDYLAVAYEVQGHEEPSRWCPKWWTHKGVVFRVTAMWRGYEQLHLSDPLTADEQFLRLIGDHHMSRLLGAHSPMRDCKTTHRQPTRLASEPMEDSHG